MSRCEVIVADNFHYQDASEHYSFGVFGSAEDAVAACKAIVERSVGEPGDGDRSTADGLFKAYALFGDDPFIVRRDPAAPEVAFSAWTYAREHAEALLSASAGAQP